MRSSSSFIVVFAVLLHAFLISADPKESFGKKLCRNMNTTASHSKSLEAGGNRTTCIVFFNDGQPKYTKTVATIFPLEKTSFQVDGTDIYDLELTSECELDPCYKIIKSPEDAFNGHYLYLSPVMDGDKQAFLAGFHCENGDLFAEKAAFYDISDKIIEDAEKIYGFKVTKDALQDCLDTANGTKSE